MPNGEDDFYHEQEIARLKRELTQCRSDAALVVHTLDCALIWGEALFAWLPEGFVLPDGVKTAKGALDIAMKQIGRQRGG